MRTGWRKIVRDIGQDRLRSALAVAAIALGIAAFFAVLSSYAILDRELNRGYLATNPASATIRADAIDDETLALVRALPGVAAAELRRAVSGRLRTGPSQWRNLTLFVVRDYADVRVSMITPEGGAWPPGPGEILIERDAFQVAKTRIGDTVTVRLGQGADRRLLVSGRVHDVGQAQARMENVVYGYVTLDTLVLLGEDPYLDQLKIVVSGDPTDLQWIGQVVARIRARLEEGGHAVRRVEIPAPGKHPHVDLMGMLLLAISSLGFLAMALGGVLVVNLTSAVMAAQVRQIGVMKALGATRGKLTSMYLGQALVSGAAAVVLALPFGTVGGRLLCRYMAIFLNFDVASAAVPAWVYGLVAVVGIATPVAAAWRPVARGAAIPVREALGDYGVPDRGFGAGALDCALAGVGGPTRPLLLAIRNSFRRRTRLALTITTLSVSGLFFMSALNIRTSMIGALDRLFATKQFDLSIALGAFYPVDQIARAVAATPGAAGWEGWITTEASVVESTRKIGPASPPPAGLHGGFGGGLHGGTAGASHGSAGDGDSPAPFPVFGVPPDSRLLALDIRQGHGLRSDDEDAVVVNSALAAGIPGLSVGQTIVLAMGPVESPWRVVGIARESFTPPAAYVSRGYFERAGGHEGMANAVRVAVEPAERASIDRFRERLDRGIEQEGIRARASSTTAESRFGFDQHMVMIYVFLVVMSAIFAGVGGLGLATTMAINVMERRVEMGVLRAIGAPVGAIWLIVVVEALVVGLVAFALAAVLAWPLSHSLGSLLARLMFRGEMDTAVDLAGVGIWLVVSLALSAAASFVPAWRASRASVREALACE